MKYDAGNYWRNLFRHIYCFRSIEDFFPRSFICSGSCDESDNIFSFPIDGCIDIRCVKTTFVNLVIGGPDARYTLDCWIVTYLSISFGACIPASECGSNFDVWHTGRWSNFVFSRSVSSRHILVTRWPLANKISASVDITYHGYFSYISYHGAVTGSTRIFLSLFTLWTDIDMRDKCVLKYTKRYTYKSLM